MCCRALLLVATSICFWPAFTHAAPGAESLTAKERLALEAVAAAWFRGDATTAVTKLAALVEHLGDDRRAAVDDILLAQKMPSLTEMLTQSRLATLQQATGKVPKLQLHEGLIVLPALGKHIADALDAAQESRVMRSPASQSATLEEYDALLWEAHVLSNRLAGAKSIADRASHLVHVTPQESKKPPEEQHRLTNTDFRELSKQIEEVSGDLSEREAALRVKRLALAVKILQTPELSRERLFAAYYWRVDVGRIESFLKQAGRRRPRSESRFSLAELNDPHLQQHVAQQGKQAERLAGELSRKAAWLFDGLFWWHRGRYGSGATVFGLAKSEEAMANTAAQFALYMPPDPRVQPTDPTKVVNFDEATPRYDRRHHYWWAWEDRRLVVGPGGPATGGTSLAGVQPFY